MILMDKNKRETKNAFNNIERKMDPDIRRALEITKKQYGQAYKNLRDR